MARSVEQVRVLRREVIVRGFEGGGYKVLKFFKVLGTKRSLRTGEALEFVNNFRKLFTESDGVTLGDEHDSVEGVCYDDDGACGIGEFHVRSNLVEVCLVDVSAPNDGVGEVGEVAFLEAFRFRGVGKEQYHLLSPLFKDFLVRCNIAQEVVGRFAVGRNQRKDVITASCCRKQ